MRQTSRIAILSLGVAAMAGCTNLDGSANRTATGGLIGAGAGALIGRAIDGGGTHRHAGRRRARQHGRRRDRRRRSTASSASSRPGCGGSGATVVNTGNQLVVTLPESITFDTGSAIVHPDYVDEIAFVARSLRDNPAPRCWSSATPTTSAAPPTTRRSASGAPPRSPRS